MDPALQTAIQNSTIISAEMRQKLLVVADRLTPEKAQKLASILEKAEQRKKELEREHDQQKRTANEAQLSKIKNFHQHTMPEAMDKAEEIEKHAEEEELGSILSELDNV